MPRTSLKVRGSTIDDKIFGEEPTLTENSTKVELIKAYNWYNYFHDNDAAKSFVVSYLKTQKYDKNKLKKVYAIDPLQLRNIGWNFRILSRNGYLTQDIVDCSWEKLESLIKQVQAKSSVEEDTVVVPVPAKVSNKAHDYIADLEQEVDKFLVTKKAFDPSEWMRQRQVKAVVAKKIAEYYRPLYSELFDAIKGDDKDLVEAYKGWKKPQLKKYMELVKSIISSAETFSVITRVSRKPRKKKEKPATALVEKLKYKEKDDTYNLTSVNPATIIGSQQTWVFNVSTRCLTVFNAIGPTGLSVKGTTIIGFDEKTSITKKIRKPEVLLPKLLSATKAGMKRLMDEVTCKPKEATGRINTDTILIKMCR